MIEYSSPVLISKTRKGNDKYWQCHVVNTDSGEHGTMSSFWQINVKGEKSIVQFSEPYVASAKNIGKKNETSSEEQAYLEFDSIVKKQMDKGYLEEGQESTILPLPMLAQKNRDHANKIVYPVYVQPKLDGMRMLFDGERAWSRGGKDIIPEVISHLQINTQGYILDGELILPGNGPLQDTLSAAKKFKNGTSNTLQYWVYDIVDESKTYTERYEILKELIRDHGNSCIILTPTYECANDIEVLVYHKKFISEGYEGTILRNKLGKYEIGHRSYNLQKMKDFFTEEFEIIDVFEGGGSAAGLAMLKVKTKNGKVFDSTPEMTREQRKELYENKNDLIGKFATIRHYGYTKDEIPIFQNTIAIRDLEDFS